MLNGIQQSENFKWSVAAAATAILAYVVTWRFYAMWWFIVFFIDLLVFLLFLIVSLSNIIFCFTGRKKFKYAFAPVCISVSSFCMIMLAPSIYRNKSYHKRTSILNNSCAGHLYLETYCVYGGGALSTDMDALYLTDSVNFRKYIGTYDEEDEMISVKCKGDSIIVEKKAKADQTFKIENVPLKGKAEAIPYVAYKIKKLNKRVFSLKDLRESHEFE